VSPMELDSAEDLPENLLGDLTRPYSSPRSREPQAPCGKQLTSQGGFRVGLRLRFLSILYPNPATGLTGHHKKWTQNFSAVSLHP